MLKQLYIVVTLCLYTLNTELLYTSRRCRQNEVSKRVAHETFVNVRHKFLGNFSVAYHITQKFNTFKLSMVSQKMAFNFYYFARKCNFV